MDTSLNGVILARFSPWWHTWSMRQQEVSEWMSGQCVSLCTCVCVRVSGSAEPCNDESLNRVWPHVSTHSAVLLIRVPHTEESLNHACDGGKGKNSVTLLWESSAVQKRWKISLERCFVVVSLKSLVSFICQAVRLWWYLTYICTFVFCNFFFLFAFFCLTYEKSVSFPCLNLFGLSLLDV